MHRHLLAGVGLLAIACPQNAQGQTAEPPIGDTEDIVVTGQRAQLQRSIELKRDSLGVIDVASADEIGQLPDRNVAEAVERLPGVGVQYDQGEGRYVAVRGVPAELNHYTINGFEIGNPTAIPAGCRSTSYRGSCSTGSRSAR
jgi:outer membrane receptor for ferrienterochelin and colicin